MVWIHGGGFVGWSGAIDSFGPHYFIDKKIVVVTVNYRLGPLGNKIKILGIFWSKILVSFFFQKKKIFILKLGLP